MGSILRYLAYLQFLPLLAQLVQFVREAEAKFKSPGSGASKSIWVRDQFAALVNTAQATALITPSLAATLIAGAGAIIDIIVAVFNASGGVPAVEPVEQPVATTPSASIYDKNASYESESEIPADDELKSQGFKAGDIVAISTIGAHFWRIVKVDPAGNFQIRSGFKQFRTIT